MMKAALSNQNDMRLVATALSGVVGQTTTAGFVPADTQAAHTHLLSWHILLQGRAKQSASRCSVGVCLGECVWRLVPSITATGMH